MNCRDAERQIFAERDGALDELQRAALVSHLAGCAACRKSQERFATAIESWRSATQAVATPDAEREWLNVRRRMRGGVVAGEVKPASRRRQWITWLALPIGAAAAAAFALWTPGEPPVAPHASGIAKASASPVALAHADAVEVSAGDGSVVFVDDKSGWVVVWDGETKQI